MKIKIHELLNTLYGMVVAVSVLAGAIVAVLFLAAFVISGHTAAVISSFNGVVMEYGKKLACFAILFGLIDFYLMQDHHLTIDQKEKDDDAPAQTGRVCL